MWMLCGVHHDALSLILKGNKTPELLLLGLSWRGGCFIFLFFFFFSSSLNLETNDDSCPGRHFCVFFNLCQILACCKIIQSHWERLGRTDACNPPVLLSVARYCPARRIESCLLHSGKKGVICVPHHLPLFLYENWAYITAGKQGKKKKKRRRDKNGC